MDMFKNVFYAFAAISVLACGVSALADPPALSDDCTNAPLLFAGTYSFTTIGASSDHDGGCNSHLPNVWAKYTYPQSIPGVVRIDTCGTSPAGAGSYCVYDSCGGAPRSDPLYSTSNCPELTSSKYLTMIPGQTILISVSANSVGTDPIVQGLLNITELQNPTNDECGTALPVGVGATYFDTGAATPTTLPPDANVLGFEISSNSRDLWFSYTATVTGISIIDTCNSALQFNTLLSAWNDCDTPFMLQDDANLILACGANGQNTKSQFAVPTTAGIPILIRVSGGPGALNDNTVAGMGTLNIAPPLPLVGNDHCGGATAVGAGLTPFDMLPAMPDGVVETCSPASGSIGDPAQYNKALWFKYTPPTSGIARIAAGGSAGSLLVTLHDSCGSPCTSASLGDYLTPSVVENHSIYIRVAVRDGNLAAYQYAGSLSIIDPAPEATNNQCTQPLSVAIDGYYSYNFAGATNSGTNAPCDRATNVDLWYRFVAPATGQVSDMIFTACGDYSGQAFNSLNADTIAIYDSSCSGSVLGCIDGTNLHGTCGLVSLPVRLGSGQAVLIRVSRRPWASGGSTGVPLGSALPGTGELSVKLVPTWYESTDGGGDAGQLLLSAQNTTGAGSLVSVRGSLADSSDIDMYAIDVCNYQEFSASFANQSGQGMIFIFDDAGIGKAQSWAYPGISSQALISNQFISHNGRYYLCASPVYFSANDANGAQLWSVDFSRPGERIPDGPGAANTVASWANVGATRGAGAYVITLTGSCFAATPCPADFDHNGTINVSDIFAFLRAWFAHSASADIDGNSLVNVSDIFAFLRHWFAHC